MDDEKFTPSEARVAVDYMHARMSRNPNISMEEADAEFDRLLSMIREEAIEYYKYTQEGEHND